MATSNIKRLQADDVGAVNISEVIQKALYNTDTSGITTYPTEQGLYRVTQSVTGLPSGLSSYYGVLFIYGAGAYYSHVYIDVNQNMYYAYKSGTGAPTAWKKAVRSDETIAVAHGGTGATTPAAARSNLEITPANIGAVNKAGDTMTGTLTALGYTVNGNWPTIFLKTLVDGAYVEDVAIQASPTGQLSFITYKNGVRSETFLLPTPSSSTAVDYEIVTTKDVRQKALYNTSTDGITAYPTEPGLYRVTKFVTGLPSGLSSYYGVLMIYGAGTYYSHVYIDANQNYYFAYKGSAGAPASWKCAAAAAAQYYEAYGLLGKSASGTMRAHGYAHVNIRGKAVTIDFGIQVTTAGSNTSKYDVGLYLAEIRARNSNIPAFTPTGTGVIHYYKADGTLNTTMESYCGTAAAYQDTYWGFGRVHTTSGDNGWWADSNYTVGMRIIGTVYGTLS